jgi:hypothetical protein
LNISDKDFGYDGSKDVFSKISDLENLETIFLEFAYSNKSKGIEDSYSKNCSRTKESEELNLENLQNDLLNEKFEFLPLKHFVLKPGKKRQHFHFGVAEQIVSRSIYVVLRELAEPYFIENLFSNRRQKSYKHAVLNLQKSMQNQTNSAVLRLDIEKYYDSIDHTILISQLKKIVDDKTLKLIKNLLQIMNPNGCGIVSGSSLSNLFGNLYLADFDILISRNLNNPTYMRFVDDMAVICKNIEEANKLKKIIEKTLDNKLKLRLSQEKSFIRSATDGCTFLGYNIFPGKLMLLENYTKTANNDLEKIISGNSGLTTKQIKCKIKAIKSKLKNADEPELREKLAKIDEILKNGINELKSFSLVSNTEIDQIKLPSQIQRETTESEIVKETCIDVAIKKSKFSSKHMSLEIANEIKNLNILDLTPWNALIIIKNWQDRILSK